MILLPTRRLPARRRAALFATLVLACLLLQPPPADAQPRAGGNERVPSELWRTYPLDPSGGAATIEREDTARPAAPPETVVEQSPAERPRGDEQPADGGGASRAGMATVAVIVALGVLASLFALLRLPAPAAAGRLPAGIPAWLETARRRAVGAVRSLPPLPALPPLPLPTTAIRDRLRGLRPGPNRVGAGLRRQTQRWTRPLVTRRPPIEPVLAADEAPDAPREPAAARASESKAPAAVPPSRPNAADELKAKARAQSESERKKLVEAEAETLKRKAASPSEAEVLKAKKGRPVPPPKDPPAGPKTPPEAEPRALAHPDPRPERPRPAAADHRSRRTSPLRPVEEPEAPPPIRMLPVERPPECTVVWWRGYIKSRFLAVGEAEPGHDPVVAASPFFRWRSEEPPPETPAIAEALQALVKSLELQGWSVSGRGSSWFSVRMQQTFGEEPVEVEQAQGPETGRKGSMR